MGGGVQSEAAEDVCSLHAMLPSCSTVLPGDSPHHRKQLFFFHFFFLVNSYLIINLLSIHFFFIYHFHHFIGALLGSERDTETPQKPD